MNLTLYINSDEKDPRLARVESLTSMLRVPLPVLTQGIRLSVTIYLVTSAGAYNALSGSGVPTKRLVLGVRGQLALATATGFAEIANGWTCTLDLTSAELANFLANGSAPLFLEFSTIATGPAKTVWASLPVSVIGGVS
jgi:hypothetical protein